MSLDAAALAAIADLELVSKRVVDGTISGLHRSPFHGYSAEFSQYRHYRPGDDLKYIDWKLFARTDRLYTKQFRETTNLQCQIALDASASMDSAGAAGSRLETRGSRPALAHCLAAGDVVGLVTYAGAHAIPSQPWRTGAPARSCCVEPHGSVGRPTRRPRCGRSIF